ncbi:MAG: 2-hydroxyglutaryl-CoA dehydratase [Clostridiaceae bacterium]|jgi:predicted nucleotide-binding protein (sugar kinase/HSP70/actin superfamily)|nr:2-hydroxyglutaryl-CoA dehydratase [Clostridiaceae bacterium]
MAENRGTVLFTKNMKKDYTILAPSMLPLHFRMLEGVLNSFGYRVRVLETSGKHIIDKGLKYVHNDTCYPALIVIGQLLDALESGKYDPGKTALLLTQTGGGCRASNYVSLLRKAVAKAGYGQIPVIPLSFANLERHPGFKLTVPMVHRMLYAVLYGDLLMTLKNQCKPYEINRGESEALASSWAERLSRELGRKNRISYRKIRENYKSIVKDFSKISRTDERKIRIGIVGEIYVKFSPIGNNNLEDFLISEGAEPVLPGLLDFCLYCVYNGIVDAELYGIRRLKAFFCKILYRFLIKKQKDLICSITENSNFRPMGYFEVTRILPEGIIGLGTKMGEGWLLTAEMLEFASQGVHGIICTQPFGCLPNHIAGKGMMNPVQKRHPDINIVALDYDPGTSRINQENRIKLMLSDAKSRAGCN